MRTSLLATSPFVCLLGLSSFSACHPTDSVVPNVVTDADAATAAPESIATTDAGSSVAPAGSAASAGPCRPPSIVTPPSCPSRVLPASNATSSRGCKSDAECKSGLQGRCIENPALSALPDRRGNLLAGPPLPPPKTLCVYDGCNTNADCGAGSRCACAGAIPDPIRRNACVALDGCLADSECPKLSLCICGAGGAANACVMGNCRSDADCASGLACSESSSGSTYCHTPKDGCKKDEDCAKPDAFRVCDFDRSSVNWACRTIPPRPPG
ncbi:hypothetical protein BH09MYX1_BH09MYX1_37730 [soil metagenome]